MFITKKHFERRTFLRGMGAAVALPLLDAMIPARTALAADRGQSHAPPGLHLLPARRDHGSLDAEDGRKQLRAPHHFETAGAFPEAPHRGQRPGKQARHQPGRPRHHARNVAELRASARDPGPLLRSDHRSDRRGAHRPGHAPTLARSGHRRPRRRRLLRSRFRLQLLRHHFFPHSHHAASHGDRAAQGFPEPVRPGRHGAGAKDPGQAIRQHSGSDFDRSHRLAAHPGPPGPRHAQRLSRHRSRNRAAHARRWKRTISRTSTSRTRPLGHAAAVRTAHRPDVRSDRAGLSGQHDAHLQHDDGGRSQQPDLQPDRRAGRVPSALASQQ